jgi:glyoxylase-like metal-dependent hydrolase (beta-lactamase superfamily II)
VTSTTNAAEDRLYFRQLLSGRDFAVGDRVASEMKNFVYAIGDRTSGQCALVDPAYSVADLLDVVAADGMTVTDVFASHYHPDHIGGSMMGYAIEGVPALLERIDVPIHVQRAEAPWVSRMIGVAESELATHEPGEAVVVGAVSVELLHTPGHTPGSQCLLVDGRLVSGDTLFLDGCGRTDLPGSDPEAMYDSLQRLAGLPDGTVVFPGHRYSPPTSATMSSIREQNFVFKPASKQQWMSMFGR